MKTQGMKVLPLLAALLTIAGTQPGFTGDMGDEARADADAGADALPAPYTTVAAGAGPAPFVPACESDDLDRNTQMQRLVGVAAVGVGGIVTMNVVGGAARSAVDFGKVKDIPIYGDGIRSFTHAGKKLPVFGPLIGRAPLIGKAAGAATIPTTLGQMPFLGPAVAKIPLAGPIIAGPPHPVVVAATAIDTYLIPKVNPCGYTPSAEFTMTDFNSPPRLRHYVNYVAPLPYTHPPIYAPATLNTGAHPNTENAQANPDEAAIVKIPLVQ